MKLDLGQGERLHLVLLPVGEFMMGETLSPEEVNRRWPSRKLEWFKYARTYSEEMNTMEMPIELFGVPLIWVVVIVAVILTVGLMILCFHDPAAARVFGKIFAVAAMGVGVGCLVGEIVAAARGEPVWEAVGATRHSVVIGCGAGFLTGGIVALVLSFLIRVPDVAKAAGNPARESVRGSGRNGSEASTLVKTE